VDGDFPWVLVAAFLLWVFNLLGGKKRTQRPQQPPRRSVPPAKPSRTASPADSTQHEGGQLEELLRALEQRLDPTATSVPRTPRPPVGRPAPRPLPHAEELEERDSLEVEPVVESLEEDVRRPERSARDWLRQAEERERARTAEVEAREGLSHKARHEAFDRRIRLQSPAVPSDPASRRLTLAEMRQAFIWSEILGPPKSER
jgi:hypothetical protein